MTISTTPNTPRIRFKGFTEPWKRKHIYSLCLINPAGDVLQDTFYYIDLESVEKGVLKQQRLITKKNAPSRAQRVLKCNDVLFQTVRPYQRNNYVFDNISEVQWVASTGYAVLRPYTSPYFLYSLLSTDLVNKEVENRCTGTAYPAITAYDLGQIEIMICTAAEQQKIGNFFREQDEVINASAENVTKLKTIKQALLQKMFAV